MKLIDIFILILMGVLGFVAGKFSVIYQEQSGYTVDLPEEIRGAHPKDSLIIERIEENTLYLGFVSKYD